MVFDHVGVAVFDLPVPADVYRTLLSVLGHEPSYVDELTVLQARSLPRDRPPERVVALRKLAASVEQPEGQGCPPADASDAAAALFITAGEHDGLWAGVRRHGELTLTIVADGASPEAVELEPLADPRAQLLGPEQ